MILHELFFDGLGDQSKPAPALRDALARDFESFERWRSEFVAMGKALGGGSGWARDPHRVSGPPEWPGAPRPPPQLLWFAVTQHPTAEWLARQITEAFPWDSAPEYLIRDQ